MPRPFGRLVVVVFAAALAAAGASAPAFACTSAGCALSTRGGDGWLAPGALSLDLSARYLDQGRRLYGSDALRVGGAVDPPVLRPRIEYGEGRIVPGAHQEWGMQGTFLQADVGYGLSPRFNVVLSLPVLNRKTVDHLVGAGTHAADHATLGEFGRASLAYDGIGDAQLSVITRPRARLRVGAGLRVPTGPWKRRDWSGLIADPLLQPGTGSWAFLGTAQYGGWVGRTTVGWEAALTYQRALATPEDYRYGDETYLTLRATRKLAGRVAAMLQTKAYYAARSTFRGQPAPSTGAVLVSAGPGLRWSGPAGIGLYSNVQVPVFQHVNEEQLGMSVVVQAGVSRAF